MEDTIMRIDLNRLSVLAGLPVRRSNLRENTEEGMRGNMSEEETEEGMRGSMSEMEEMEEMEEMYMETEEAMDMNEMIEVDEVMLVQELRRAKRLMNESRNKEARKQAIFENNLKKIIDEEVQNVMAEMNLNSDWVYGRRKPTRSRKGYTHQGSFMPGFGFKR